MPGIPASLTSATDLPEFSSLINREVLLCELFLLKLVNEFVNSYLFIIFFVCLVSSQATKETFLRIFNAL